MSQLDRFLNGTPSGALVRRDAASAARQISADNGGALVEVNRDARAHERALLRQGRIAARTQKGIDLTAELVKHAREKADGDEFASELILETLTRGHRKINDQI